VTVIVTVLYLMWLNRRREEERAKEGKPRKIRDLSMKHRFGKEDDDAEKRMSEEEEDERLGRQAFLDMTDFENNEFVYVY